jgi:hypothetical protein
MVKHKNIIDFNSNRRSTPVESAVAVPQLVTSVQRTVKHHLKELLPKFFSQIDNSLFDLADKAESNQLQTLYFDAMREIRLQHDLMQKIYFNALESGFKLSLSQAVITSHSNDKLDKVSLVEDEQLEESLAISNMANAADNAYRQALSDLTARLNFLIEGTEITKENSPLRPEVLCNAFSVAAGCMNTEIKVRLVVYKLFDKVVIQQLGEMYDTINADLIASGVLPRIKSAVYKPDNSPSHDKTVESSSSQDNSDPKNDSVAINNSTQKIMNTADNVFTSLQQLLSEQRGESDGSDSGIQNNQISEDGIKSKETYSYTPEDVVAALSQLQISAEAALLQNKNQESANIIKSTVMKEISKFQGKSGKKQIAQADIDSIDIVSRLFDFILDDPGLTDSLKVQIVRLQIPLLKVAILDNDFFSTKSHPARQLLNELAYAGSGLETTDPEEDATLKMVSYVVDRIQAEFEENTGIIESLLAEFTAFMEREKESNKLTEDVLVGAKNTAAEAIQSKVYGHNIPPLVNTILLDAWKDVLIHLYLRDGVKSNAWETALQVADDLIWSVEPKLIVSERNRLIKVIPGILNGLRDGFTLINFDMKKSEVLFDELEDLHLASLRGGIPENIPTQKSKMSKQENSLINYEESDILTEDDFGVDLSDLPENTSFADEQANSYSEDIASSSKKDDEMLFSIYAESISELALGTWVEFIDPATKSHSRGKLAWKCDFTKEFTFVDRKYKVVADLTYHQLIEKFELEHASVVEDIPLFDRALDSVIVGIKQALDIKNSAGSNSNH